MFVHHALTGDAHAAGHHGDPARRGWWDRLIGPGPPDRHRPLLRHLAEPARRLPGDDRALVREPGDRPRGYGLEFPMFSVRDLNTVHRRLLDHLGIARLHAALGGSLGGMQALQWALDDPQAMTLLRRDLRERRAERDEHRVLHRRARGDHARPRLPGRRVPRQPAGPEHRPRRRAHDGPHHLPLRGVLRPQVRPRAARRGRAAGPRPGLRGRALPAPPGRELPRALRRADVPLPHAHHGLLHAVRGGRRARAPAREPDALPRRSRSTPTGASPARTRSGSSASCGRPGAPPSTSTSHHPGGTTRSCWTCRSTTPRSGTSCAGSGGTRRPPEAAARRGLPAGVASGRAPWP